MRASNRHLHGIDLPESGLRLWDPIANRPISLCDAIDTERRRLAALESIRRADVQGEGHPEAREASEACKLPMKSHDPWSELSPPPADIKFEVPHDGP